MALEYVTFYSVTGEEISVPNIVAQMIDYYQQKREIGETKITDFNEGSEIRNLLEAVAVGIFALLEQDNENAKLPFISLSEGEWLDRIGENPFINLPRIQGAVATGGVTFTLAEAQDTEVVIPSDTILTDSFTGLDFATDNDCVIPIGETSSNITASCLTEGSDGNSRSGDITIISDVNEGLNLELISVSNSDVFTGGADYEDDEDYRQRLLNNVQSDGFGSLPYYKNLCESVEGVHDVLFLGVEDYTKQVLVNGFTKPVADSVILDVTTELTKPENIVLNHTFTVSKAMVHNVNLTLTLQVTSEIDEDEIKANLNAYVNGNMYDRMEYAGLNINEPLTIDGIRSCLEVFPEFVSVTANADVFTPDTNKVIKLNTINITQNEV